MSAMLTVERELYFPGDVVRIRVSVKGVREVGVTWLGLQVRVCGSKFQTATLSPSAASAATLGRPNAQLTGRASSTPV